MQEENNLYSEADGLQAVKKEIGKVDQNFHELPKYQERSLCVGTPHCTARGRSKRARNPCAVSSPTANKQGLYIYIFAALQAFLGRVRGTGRINARGMAAHSLSGPHGETLAVCPHALVNR